MRLVSHLTIVIGLIAIFDFPVAAPGPRGVVLLEEQETIYLFRDGVWKEWFHPGGAVSIFQIGEKAFVYPRDVTTDPDNPQFENTDAEILTGRLTAPPPGLQRLRNLDNGNAVFMQEFDASAAVYEYRGTARLRVIFPQTPGYKGFAFLPDGRFLYQYQPFQLEKPGPSILYYNDGKRARAMATSDPILYPRFVNNGSHITWVHELTAENKTSKGTEEDDDQKDRSFALEAIDLTTGKSRRIGEFTVPAQWPAIEANFITWDSQPFVAIKNGNGVRILHVATGKQISVTQLTRHSDIAGSMMLSFGGSESGYSFGKHLMIADYAKNKLRFLRLPDLTVDFEVPLPSKEEVMVRAVVLPDL